MQTSMVFSQLRWPGAGDVDDCWCVSGIQLVNVTAPWLRLVGVPEFRRAAGDPDDGDRDGGNVREIVTGIEGCFPELAARIRGHRGTTWDDFRDTVRDHHPVSVAVSSHELPRRMRYGFDGLHQVTIACKADGTWRLANPLAPVYSRWQPVDPGEIREAVMHYGQLRTGDRGAWYVSGPTDLEAIAAWRGREPEDDAPPEDEDLEEQLARAEAERDELQRRADEAIDVLDGPA